MLIDLPMTSVASDDRFGLTLALGSDGRFKQTPVIVEANGQPLASLRVDRAATMGVATSLLSVGPATVIDRVNSVDVLLSNPQALLYHADGDALAMGANALLIGNEMIQFGRALTLGGGGYRLSELIRGGRGSDYAIPSHAIGEAVALLDPASLVWIAMDRALIGAQVVARAYGVADDETNPPFDTALAGGENIRPLSPCHVDVSSDGTAYSVRWIPRRRNLVG